MLKIILQNPHHVSPFNERARDLRIMNKPLWLSQRDVLAPYTHREVELPFGAPLPETTDETLVYRDNLYFDSYYIQAFVEAATARGKACQAAFSASDPAFREHALPLSVSYTQQGDIYLAELWYYPHGPSEAAEAMVIDLQTEEMGYYRVPTYMAYEQGDLVFQVPKRALIAIDSWVHIQVTDLVFGLFAGGARYTERLNKDLWFKLKVLATAMYEGKQVLNCSALVTIGHNCTISPSAVINGPTTIGDNVVVEAGTTIDCSVIGNNVNIGQGCQLNMCVIGDGTFLPFRASLTWSTVMDNSMVAQNTCLQMCVLGRSTFVGAGNTFTDYNLLPAPIRAMDGDGKLGIANRPVLGGCIGHNCRMGSGMIVFPARTIESDVVLFASRERRVLDRDVRYEDSDHHGLKFKNLHPRLYPRPGETADDSW
jgi:acetyltransferase-like isoleucine patch superfamily enzyme